MANSETTPNLPVVPSPDKKDNLVPISSKIAELTESKSELTIRIESLKQDLTNWRSKLDSQVTVYRDELLELKKTLKVDVDDLQSQFQELRTTLQKQQEDVAASLKDLGLQDYSADVKEAEKPKVEEDNEEVHASPVKEVRNESEN